MGLTQSMQIHASSSQHDKCFPIKALVLLFSSDWAHSQVKTIKSRKCLSAFSSN